MQLAICSGEIAMVSSPTLRHQWGVATHIEDVAPEEMQRRSEEWTKQTAKAAANLVNFEICAFAARRYLACGPVLSLDNLLSEAVSRLAASYSASIRECAPNLSRPSSRLSSRYLRRQRSEFLRPPCSRGAHGANPQRIHLTDTQIGLLGSAFIWIYAWWGCH